MDSMKNFNTVVEVIKCYVQYSYGSKAAAALPASLAPSTRLTADLRLDSLDCARLWQDIGRHFHLEYIPQSIIWNSERLEDIVKYVGGGEEVWQAAAALDGAALNVDSDDETAAAAASSISTILLFPGQGQQRIGMALEAAKTIPNVSSMFQQANDVLGYDLRQLLANGPQQALDETKVAQPAMLIANLAAYEVYKQQKQVEEVEFVACAGLSVGEYAALVVAGVLTLDEALRVVKRRAESMQECSQQHNGGMTAVLGLSNEKVEELVARVRQKAKDGDVEGDECVLTCGNYLCSGNIAVSGSKAELSHLEELATKEPFKSKKVTRLAVSGAFHSAAMSRAAAAVADALKQVNIKPPSTTTHRIVMNSSANEVNGVDELCERLVRQVESPVLWHQSIGRLLEIANEAGDELVKEIRIVELGPGRVLTGLMRHIIKAMNGDDEQQRRLREKIRLENVDVAATSATNQKQ